MTEKEWNRKAGRRLGLSIGSYLLAYLYLVACYMLKAPEEVAGYGFVILTLIGAVNAFGTFGNCFLATKRAIQF